MATVRGYSWLSIARVLAGISLLLLILIAIVPGVPEWLILVAVGLLAVAIMLG